MYTTGYILSFWRELMVLNAVQKRALAWEIRIANGFYNG